MKFKLRGRMRSCPSIGLDTQIEPVDFKLSLQGGLHGALGPFEAEVGEFPLRMAIPFLRRRPVLATVGPVPMHMKPIGINLEKAYLDGSGVAGLKGIQAKISSKIDCSTDVDVKGEATGRVGLSHLDLGSDEKGK